MKRSEGIHKNIKTLGLKVQKLQSIIPVQIPYNRPTDNNMTAILVLNTSAENCVLSTMSIGVLIAFETKI